MIGKGRWLKSCIALDVQKYYSNMKLCTVWKQLANDLKWKSEDLLLHRIFADLPEKIHLQHYFYMP